MGDIADELVAFGMEELGWGDPHGDSDWRYDDDDLGDMRGVRLFRWTPRKTCRYCGAYPLYWKQIEGKWRLLDWQTHAIHRCKQYKRS